MDSTPRPPTEISRPGYGPGSRLTAAILSRGGHAVNTKAVATNARTATAERLRFTVRFLQGFSLTARETLRKSDATCCYGVLFTVRDCVQPIRQHQDSTRFHRRALEPAVMNQIRNYRSFPASHG